MKFIISSHLTLRMLHTKFGLDWCKQTTNSNVSAIFQSCKGDERCFVNRQNSIFASKRTNGHALGNLKDD